ncbi:MAG: DUF3817 domain-containing protein [Thiovulaceae bacterium]|nr:DUF3817 domain-containing protein [Sulfurimonadaceae bacterium]
MNISKLKLLSSIEGTSWLLLLFIAMPLKYVWAYPLAVKYIGMAHGILFVGLVYMISVMVEKQAISKGVGAKIFIASLIPFGTYYTNKTLLSDA